MLRRFGAGFAVLALLYGFSAAPYTHGHSAIDSVSDAHHPRGHTLVHTHATPHTHDDGEDAGREGAATGHGDERIWSVASFVFPQPALSHVDTPAVLMSAQPSFELTRGSLRVHRPQPQAHGPPLAWSLPLRAPPVRLPAIA